MNPPDFAHVILTSFNVRLGWDDARVVDPVWLRRRFELFEAFCYPSVRTQTNQRFRWLVHFDDQTPEEFRERLARYPEWANFIPVFAPKATPGQVVDRVAAETGDARFVITTRLDNDDAVARDYVEKVQGQFDGQDLQYVNFPSGYVLSKNKLYAARRESNAFISLIEERDALQTVWSCPHYRVRDIGPVEEIESPPMWLQVVHGGNRGNRRVDCVRVPLQGLEERFALSANLERAESRLAVATEGLINRVEAKAMTAFRRVRGRLAR